MTSGEDDSPAAIDLSSEQIRLTKFTDLVAFLAALLAAPLALFFENWAWLFGSASMAILGALVAVACCADLVIVVLIRRSPLPAYSISGMAARLGARAGFVVAIAGGALFVLVATLSKHEFAFASSIAGNPSHTITIVGLSVVAVVFVASLGAVLLSSIRRNSPDESAVASTPATSPNDQTGHRSLLPWIMGFSAICLLSPGIALIPIPKPEDEIVVEPTLPTTTPEGELAKDAETADSATSTATVESVPSYLVPSGFHTAHAAQWRIEKQHVLHDVHPRHPTVLSPTGQYFAYCNRQRPENVIVFDLHALRVKASFDSLRDVRQLAWAPKSDRLFCVSSGEQSSAFVLRLDDEKVFALPLAENVSLPDVQPFWWTHFEVAFFPTPEPKLWLDLGDLRHKPIADSEKWRHLVGEDDKFVGPPPPSQLPESSQCRMTVAPKIGSYLSPGFQQAEWSLKGHPVIAVIDKVQHQAKYFPSLEIENGDRLVTAAETTKLICIRESVAEVTFFDFDARPPAYHRIATPEGLNMEVAEGFLSHLDAGTLCAFITAPLINPLTEEVVGPDRRRVKAIARFEDWTDGSATISIAEEYYPVELGDVLTDFHFWEDGRPVAVMMPLPDDWWSAIQAAENQEPDQEATPKKVPPLDRHWSSQLQPDRGGLRFSNFVYPAVRPKGFEPLPQLTQNGSEPASTPPPTEDLAPPEERVRSFINEHYQKLSAGDFDGFLSDYTDFVVYYGETSSEQEPVRKKIEAWRKMEKVQAAVTTEISVVNNPADESRYDATFEVEIKTDYGSGIAETKRTEIEAGLIVVGEKVQIITERDVNADLVPQPALTASDRSAGDGRPASPASSVDAKTTNAIRAFVTDHVRRGDKPDDRWIAQHVDRPVANIDAKFRITQATARQDVAAAARLMPQKTTIVGQIEVKRWKGSRNHYFVTFPLVTVRTNGRQIESVDGKQGFWIVAGDGGFQVYGAGKDR